MSVTGRAKLRFIPEGKWQNNMFHGKIKTMEYDRNNQKPVIRSSICTGEKVAGFRDMNTGKFTEIMMIRDNKDLDKFLTEYDISVAEIKTEW